MSDKKWKPGDVVRLKSGGPKMTVDCYVPNMVPGAAASDLSVLDTRMVQNGESVRCNYFCKLPGGEWPAYPAQCQIHESALVTAEGEAV